MRGSRLLIVLLVPFLLGGCGGGNAYKAWQTSLEGYVDKEGNGDLNALRNTGTPDSPPQFGLIGARHGGMPLFSPKRTDVTGVLLGHRQIGRSWWYVYLVGAIQFSDEMSNFPVVNPDLTDIRVMAVTDSEGGLVWIESPPDAEALERYRSHQIRQWQSGSPAHADRTDGPTMFPSDHDDFTLDVTSTRIGVTDGASGAAREALLGGPER